jgi:hypothetical protein
MIKTSQGVEKIEQVEVHSPSTRIVSTQKQSTARTPPHVVPFLQPPHHHHREQNYWFPLSWLEHVET